MKTAVAALLAGSVLLASPTVAPTNALSISGLSVSDVSRSVGPNDALQSVSVDVQAQYEYSSSHELTSAELVLYAAPAGGSFEPVDTLTLDAPGTNGSGTADLSGDLTALPNFDVSDFDANEGQTATQDVEFKLVMELHRDGTRVGIADAEDVATVSVSREEMTVSAQVAGTGSMAVGVG